jgi:phage virion morphogenesis (putative tail completion) protein
MTDELTHLETWLSPLLAKLSAPARRTLAVAIGRRLRASQQQRIAAQLDPRGMAFAPRKLQEARLRKLPGKIRRRKAAMFTKLRAARWLKVVTSAQGVDVGFDGRAARIARVHQEGLDDKASPKSKTIRYPRRQLLGFTEADRKLIGDALAEHLRGV